MGWFDGKSRTSTSTVRRRASPSRRSTYSTTSSRGERYTRHTTSAPSTFSLGGGGGGGSSSRQRRSSPSVFSSVSSASRRVRPREGYIKRIVQYIKRLFRDIYMYAKNHPAKVFFLVIVPLITSGVLVKLLGMVGIRLPQSFVNRLGGGAFKANPGQTSPGNGVKQSVTGLMNIAKMFM
ncbi:hypothetical protein ASPZODRAFT_130913 [Penicilliopsis zonata CBS 506.65]|uniref:Uncharacterized protein n=1 Tax=Penicilliopsis zonata CBS 506.65 TaxID=1073090 RepID=A0A1L9SJS6_9EURO|nr:hypothetical protein ASPZODRAFT_130913 [Penicilliopsis zonata CBS 506.65]OJJ47448.1 hypothetical protein ASPZODRAFT_130913 [Penicilliopsis zonata CBS 506.65]